MAVVFWLTYHYPKESARQTSETDRKLHGSSPAIHSGPRIRWVPNIPYLGCRIRPWDLKLPQLLQRGRSALGDYNQPNISKESRTEHNPTELPGCTKHSSLGGAPLNHNCSPLASRGILWQCHCSSIPGSNPWWYRKSWGTYGKI